MIHFKPEDTHRQDIKLLQTSLLKNSSLPFTLSLEKRFSNTLRNEEYKKHSCQLSLASLSSPILLNPKEKWITVEPRITFRKLVDITLKYGFIPEVVPEFSGITVGGAILGAAIESSSHQFGQFNDTCLEYELLLGDGNLIYASPDQHADLFYGLSGSYGSLAILTKVKMRIRPAQPYVHLHYHRFQDTQSCVNFFKEASIADFLDGVKIENHWLVAMRGEFTSNKTSTSLYRQSKPWDPWFFSHIAQKTKYHDHEDILPIKDYLFRFDRSAFWMGRFLAQFSLFKRAYLKNNLSDIRNAMKLHVDSLHPSDCPSRLFRFFLGWAFTSQRLYRLWHAVPKHISENIFFIQDFYVPWDKVSLAINHLQKRVNISPLWLCPVKGTLTPQFLSPHYGKDFFVNLGFYGIPDSSQSIPLLTAEVEQEVLTYEGKKMLYSLTYYPEKIFSKVYNEPRYNELRKKYHAEQAFLPLYKKVVSVL